MLLFRSLKIVLKIAGQRLVTWLQPGVGQTFWQHSMDLPGLTPIQQHHLRWRIHPINQPQPYVPKINSKTPENHSTWYRINTLPPRQMTSGQCEQAHAHSAPPPAITVSQTSASSDHFRQSQGIFHDPPGRWKAKAARPTRLLHNQPCLWDWRSLPTWPPV